MLKRDIAHLAAGFHGVSAHRTLLSPLLQSLYHKPSCGIGFLFTNLLAAANHDGYLASGCGFCSFLRELSHPQVLEGTQGKYHWLTSAVFLIFPAVQETSYLPGLRSLVTPISRFGATIPTSRFNPGLNWQWTWRHQGEYELHPKLLVHS